MITKKKVKNYNPVTRDMSVLDLMLSTCTEVMYISCTEYNKYIHVM